MITTTNRYNVSNVNEFHHHMVTNVIDPETNQYVIDIIPIFSGAQTFNDYVDATGIIESVELIKGNDYVELQIKWSNEETWLSFCKENFGTDNGLSNQHRFVRSNYNGDIKYESDTESGQALINDFLDFIVETVDSMEDGDKNKTYASLPLTDSRFKIPESGW